MQPEEKAIAYLWDMLQAAIDITHCSHLHGIYF
jgi:hypothetical protein